MYVIDFCRAFVRSQILFTVCFLSIISLEKLFDWGGEQLAMYCGPDLGDLIIITFNKYVCLIRPPSTFMLNSADTSLSFLAWSRQPSQLFFSFDARMCPF